MKKDHAKEHLYHVDKYIDKNLLSQVANQKYLLNAYAISRHVIEKLLSDTCRRRSYKYTLADIHNAIQIILKNKVQPFEVASVDGIVTKYVIRTKLDATHDLCLVIRQNIIVTAYVNSSLDNHQTIDLDRYCTKEDWLNEIKYKK